MNVGSDTMALNSLIETRSVEDKPTMRSLSRREFVALSLTASAVQPALARAEPANVHEQLLGVASRQEERRRARFAAVKSKDDLEALQKELRQKFLRLLGGLPERKETPPARIMATIDAGDYLVEKLVYESFPSYFVSALLYKPKKISSPLPAVLSPCGHSTTGKAEQTYQILHINLVKRGYVVLTYDPVGQGERSQFWDAEKAWSRFNLSCGEHAVLGNPLYLIGSSLARYRIWDGLRGLDYLVSRSEVDATRIGCVGNSGGGTLSAYISALDPRISAVAICCYITTLRRRMGNRITDDPSADPEQDFFGFVSEGIDHAGLLALLAPRPTLVGSARFDFFPIEGARESFEEAKRLFEIAGAGDRVERVEAAERHGLTLPLRRAVYTWFDRWLSGHQDSRVVDEIAVTPRPARELLVCASGQVNQTFQSRPLLPLALREFDRRGKPSQIPLRDLLGLDPELATPGISEIAGSSRDGTKLLLCINGNEARDWREETEFLRELAQHGFAVSLIDPRGVGRLRPPLRIWGRDYADPLEGVEENIAYNAFLVGKSLVGMRVTDVLMAVRKIMKPVKPQKVVLCGRRDAALIACLAAAVEPSITHVAAEELLLSYRPFFAARGAPINAASILPGILEHFGDVGDVLAEVAPRRVLISAGVSESSREIPSVTLTRERFTSNARLLVDWLGN
jgi:cephalosporin-C deacetylase-like acetyl esterase